MDEGPAGSGAGSAASGRPMTENLKMGGGEGGVRFLISKKKKKKTDPPSTTTGGTVRLVPHVDTSDTI